MSSRDNKHLDNRSRNRNRDTRQHLQLEARNDSHWWRSGATQSEIEEKEREREGEGAKIEANERVTWSHFPETKLKATKNHSLTREIVANYSPKHNKKTQRWNVNRTRGTEMLTTTIISQQEKQQQDVGNSTRLTASKQKKVTGNISNLHISE